VRSQRILIVESTPFLILSAYPVFQAVMKRQQLTMSWDFVQNRLDDAGVHGNCLKLCTYGDEKRFFSYRRKTHRDEPDYGRQISVITLE